MKNGKILIILYIVFQFVSDNEIIYFDKSIQFLWWYILAYDKGLNIISAILYLRKK